MIKLLRTSYSSVVEVKLLHDKVTKSKDLDTMIKRTRGMSGYWSNVLFPGP